MRTCKIYSLNNFLIYNMVFLAIVTMLYITSPGIVYLMIGSLYLWTTFTHFLCPPPHPPSQSLVCSLNLIIQPPKLLLVSQTFVITQATFFVLMAPGSWGYAKTCQCPKGEEARQPLDAGWLKAGHPAAAYKYVKTSLWGEHCEMGVYVRSFGGTLRGGCLCSLFLGNTKRCLCSLPLSPGGIAGLL